MRVFAFSTLSNYINTERTYLCKNKQSENEAASSFSERVSFEDFFHICNLYKFLFKNFD